MGKHTWKETERSKTKDHTQMNPLLPPSPPSEAPVNVKFGEAIVLGYFAKREDFEVEYDNECELLVSQLEDDYPSSNSGAIKTNENSEDDELVKNLNVVHVEMYKAKLRERERRKRVSRDHNLISEFDLTMNSKKSLLPIICMYIFYVILFRNFSADYFKENPLPGDKKLSNQGGSSSKKKIVKDPIIEKMKILSEFQSVKEHQNFIASLTKEKDIKNRIKDLMRMRKNGITKISDSVEFEVQRVRRNNRKKNEKRRLQQNAILGEHAAELNMSMTLAPSPLSIKSEDLGSAAPSPAQPIFGALPSSPKIDDKVWIILKMRYFQKTRQIIFLPFWQTFLNFGGLIGCSAMSTNQKLQNSKKFVKKENKYDFTSFFENTSPLGIFFRTRLHTNFCHKPSVPPPLLLT